MSETAGTGNRSTFFWEGFEMSHRKLTAQDVTEIRYRVGSAKLSARRAAIEWDVSPKTIAGIMRGRLYVSVVSPSAPSLETERSTPPVASQALSVAVYRTEKSRRGDRMAPILREAKEHYEQVLASQREAGGKTKRGGGRPLTRLVPTARRQRELAVDRVDLAESMEPYHGEYHGDRRGSSLFNGAA